MSHDHWEELARLRARFNRHGWGVFYDSANERWIAVRDWDEAVTTDSTEELRIRLLRWDSRQGTSLWPAGRPLR